jgi:hypothetical protein
MKRVLMLVLSLGLSVLFAGSLFAQNAQISGTVKDKSDAVIPNSSLTLTNVNTGVKVTAKTNDKGVYLFTGLVPGRYTLTAESSGFGKTVVENLTVDAGSSINRDVVLQVAGTTETVTVEGGAPLVNTVNATVSTVVDHEFIDDMPLNGHTLNSLIALQPGVTVANASIYQEGQFSVNGMRTDSNYFSVDGVSANFGVSPYVATGQGFGGVLPAMGANGGTNSLLSLDAMQEFQIQTSTFAPEYGRQPGALVNMVSRGGTNSYHGDVYDYFQNSKLYANDWFASAGSIPKPNIHLNDFGGVFGGPIRKDKTFFFLSYEGTQSDDPVPFLAYVPSAAFRTSAPAAVQPFLNEFPFAPSFATPYPGSDGRILQYEAEPPSLTSFNAGAVRIDQVFGNGLSMFVRYNYAPSDGQNGVGGSVSSWFFDHYQTQTFTAGLTKIFSPTITNEFHFNWSRMTGANTYRQYIHGGGVMVDNASMYPYIGSNVNNGLTAFLYADDSGAFLEWFLGLNANNQQQQLNALDNIAITRGSHQLKFGFDGRYLTPNLGGEPYWNYWYFIGTSSISTQTPFYEGGRELSHHTRMENYSMFAQDTWKVTSRLTLTYGARYDITPPPYVPGEQPYDIANFNNPSAWTLAPYGRPLYKTQWDEIAPRVGVAYKINSAGTWVVRAGGGIFYDLGTANAFNKVSYYEAPYSYYYWFYPIQMPVAPQSITPPPIGFPPSGVFPYFTMIDPNFLNPRAEQYNVQIERSLGPSQSLSMTYLGSKAQNLNNGYYALGLNPNFPEVQVIQSTAYSNYNALQLQFQRRMSAGLQAMVGYTYSHSLDNSSSDQDIGTNDSAQAKLASLYASSDFDIRHTMNAAVTYNIPTASSFSPTLKNILGHWSVDSIFHYRTAPPVNIFASYNYIINNANFIPQRPDVVPGQPYYLSGSACAANNGGQGCPGGKSLNPAAFANPASLNVQGDLGRNALRAYGLIQEDLTIRREFPLHREGMKLQFRADAFNLTNHPNFGLPYQYLTGGQYPFGRPTAMLNNQLSQGGFSGSGLNPLNQVGGPRDLQLALKLYF